MAIVQAPPTMLADVAPGSYRCEQVHAEGENAVRLKRLGLCEGRTVELVSQGDPMVLRIGVSRVGLSRQLAKLVTVTTLEVDSSYGSMSPSVAL